MFIERMRVLMIELIAVFNTSCRIRRCRSHSLVRRIRRLVVVVVADATGCVPTDAGDSAGKCYLLSSPFFSPLLNYLSLSLSLSRSLSLISSLLYYLPSLLSCIFSLCRRRDYFDESEYDRYHDAAIDTFDDDDISAAEDAGDMMNGVDDDETADMFLDDDNDDESGKGLGSSRSNSRSSGSRRRGHNGSRRGGGGSRRGDRSSRRGGSHHSRRGGLLISSPLITLPVSYYFTTISHLMSSYNRLLISSYNRFPSTSHLIL